MDSKGVATHPAPMLGYPPLPGIAKGAGLFVKGVGAVNSAKFHRIIKPSILKSAGNYHKIVGKNPDVFIQKGNIMLKGTGGGFKGKIYNTGLNVIDFFY